MEKRYRQYMFVFVIITVGIVLAFLLISYHQEVKEPTIEERERDVQAEEQKRDDRVEIGEPEMIAAREGPVLESPLLDDKYAKEVRKAIQDGGWLRKRESGIKTYLPLYFEGAHPQIPMVEFRFLKENQNGELESLFVEHVWPRRRVGRSSKVIRSDWELGGHFPVEGHALRVGAGLPQTGIRFLVFGGRYHLNYKAVDPDTGEVNFYDSIIRVPDHIPDGKMAVIEVIAKHLTEDRVIRSSPEDEKVSITGVVNRPLPAANAEWYVAYNHSEKVGSATRRIAPDGSFDLGERKLGGMLRIVEKGGLGVAWMIVDSVQQKHLNLPEDADRIISRETARYVGIEVPEEYISEDFVGVWLKDDKDDTGPIAAKAYRSASSEEFQEFLSTKTLRMNAPPGRYWVEAFYDPGVVEGRKWKTLGHVTVSKEDSEEGIPLQPQ